LRKAKFEFMPMSRRMRVPFAIAATHGAGQLWRILAVWLLTGMAMADHPPARSGDPSIHRAASQQQDERDHGALAVETTRAGLARPLVATEAKEIELPAGLAAQVARLSASTPADGQETALTALEREKPAWLGREIVARWRAIHPRLRPRVVGLLTKNSRYHDALVEGLESGQILAGELSLDPAARREFLRAVAPSLAARVRKFLDPESNFNRNSAVEKLLAMLPSGEGSLDTGFHVFIERCQMCHVRGKYGNRVGPDLVNLSARGTEDLLSHIIDPNRAIAPAYVPCTVVTKSGDRWTGVLRDETAESLTLVLPLGTAIPLRREEVASITTVGRSLMPE
jgi:putative heme-binding domain-containing protein